MNRETFAVTISRLRNERGMSQKKLGDLLGVSNKAVSKWENGEAMPKTETLFKIADVFSLDISELMSGEAKSEPRPTGEIDELKAENALLRSQLTAKDKKKRRSVILAVIICVAAIGASCLIAFITGSDLADNKGLNDLGKNGTQIEFSGRTFEPATPIDKTVYLFDDGNDYFSSRKEAGYTDLDGKKSKVLIHCNELFNYVLVKKAGKDYYYIDSKDHIEISAKTLESVTLIYGKTIAKGKNYEIMDRLMFRTDDRVDETPLNAFFNFYNNRKETKDERAAELFLGNECCTVELEFNESADYAGAMIGEFFTGKDGKIYYYDYSDTKTYDVGWEMAGYVKGNQKH